MADDADRAQEHMERMESLYRRQRQPVPLSQSTECAECGSDIEPARLKAAPYATRCIECQQWHESKQKLEVFRG